MKRSKIVYNGEDWDTTAEEAEEIFEEFVETAAELDFYLERYEEVIGAEADHEVERVVEGLEETYKKTEQLLNDVNSILEDIDLRAIHLHPYFPDSRSVEAFQDKYGEHPEEVREEDPEELYMRVAATKENQPYEVRKRETELHTVNSLLAKTEKESRSRLSVSEEKAPINPLFNKYQEIEEAFHTYNNKAFDTIIESNPKLSEQYGLDLNHLLGLPEDATPPSEAEWIV